MKSFSIVVAMDEKNGIGKNNTLAWRLSADLKHFKEITTQTQDPQKINAVIMGRETWDSLPEKFRPLPNRLNIVLSQNKDLQISQGGIVQASLEEALQKVTSRSDIDQVFVIGGAQIYDQAISHSDCKSLYITCVKGDFHCDAFFPQIPDKFKDMKFSSWQTEGAIQYRFALYQRLS